MKRLICIVEAIIDFATQTFVLCFMGWVYLMGGLALYQYDLITDAIYLALMGVVFIQFAGMQQIADKQGEKSRKLDAEIHRKMGQVSAQLRGLRKDATDLRSVVADQPTTPDWSE